MRSNGIADAEVAIAVMLVDLTGKYGNERVPHHPEVPLVGGPIDALKITGSGIEWIRRKNLCPSN